MMKMNNKYYRIVYFKNNKFWKVVITSDEKEVKFLINSQIPDIEIYKCNVNGNNYSGRRIY